MKIRYKKPRITRNQLSRLLEMLPPGRDYRDFRAAVQRLIKRGVPREQLVSRMLRAGFPDRYVYDAAAEHSLYDLRAPVVISLR